MNINLKKIFIGNPFYKGRSFAYDWEFLMEKYKSIVKKDMLVVEVGSSNHQRTQDLAKYCKKLFGIEIDKTKLCFHGNNVEIINADWQQLSAIFEPGRVDIIISSHVIEHVPDDLKALNASYETLKPGGQLFFITPNRNRLSRYIGEKLHLGHLFIYDEHKREYTETDLLNLLSKSKFKNFKINSVVFGLHSGKFMFYLKECPKIFRNLTNFWIVQLTK